MPRRKSARSKPRVTTNLTGTGSSTALLSQRPPQANCISSGSRVQPARAFLVGIILAAGDAPRGLCTGRGRAVCGAELDRLPASRRAANDDEDHAARPRSSLHRSVLAGSSGRTTLAAPAVPAVRRGVVVTTAADHRRSGRKRNRHCELTRRARAGVGDLECDLRQLAGVPAVDTYGGRQLRRTRRIATRWRR